MCWPALDSKPRRSHSVPMSIETLAELPCTIRLRRPHLRVTMELGAWFCAPSNPCCGAYVADRPGLAKDIAKPGRGGARASAAKLAPTALPRRRRRTARQAHARRFRRGAAGGFAAAVNRVSPTRSRSAGAGFARNLILGAARHLSNVVGVERVRGSHP